MHVKIPWICGTCGEFGEIDAELPSLNLDGMTLEDAAAVTLEALRTVVHPHPVRIGSPACC